MKEEEEFPTNARATCSTKNTNSAHKGKILYKDESYRINHCVFEVYRKLGGGFLEVVYQEAMEIELKKQNIPFEPQKEIQIVYNDQILQHTYRADLVCFEKIIVEIKAVSKIVNEHKAQLLNYLAATKLKLGLLVNFWASPKAEIIRIVK
jgi:GxxExxY protein